MTTQNKVTNQEKKTQKLWMQIVDYIAKNKKYNQTVIAKESGINPTVLNKWIKCQYGGDNEKIEASLQKWLTSQLNDRPSQVIPNAPEFVPTQSAKNIISTLHYAQYISDICVIYGGAGVGKTLACANYARNHNNVWHVTMTPSTSSVSNCFKRIAIKLNLKSSSSTVADLEMALINRLDGTNGILIIDEAQHLNVKALEALRSLHDASNVAIALVGNEQVYTQLTGGVRAAAFAQLFSRIGKRLRLNSSKNIDLEDLITAWGVDEKASKKILMQIGKKEGALRGVVKCLKLAHMIAHREKNQMNVIHITKAWADLSGETITNQI